MIGEGDDIERDKLKRLASEAASNLIEMWRVNQSTLKVRLGKPLRQATGFKDASELLWAGNLPKTSTGYC